jgi:hypothetical protein
MEYKRGLSTGSIPERKSLIRRVKSWKTYVGTMEFLQEGGYPFGDPIKICGFTGTRNMLVLRIHNKTQYYRHTE